MLNNLSASDVLLDVVKGEGDIPIFTESQLNASALHAAFIMKVAIDTPRLFVITIEELRRRIDPKILENRSDDYLRRIVHSLILAGWLEPSGRGWVLTGSLARANVRCRQLLNDMAMKAQRMAVDLYPEPEV